MWAAPPKVVDAYVWEEAEDAFALELLSDVEVMPAELPSAELPVPVVLPDSLEQDRMESCLKRGDAHSDIVRYHSNILFLWNLLKFYVFVFILFYLP